MKLAPVPWWISGRPIVFDWQTLEDAFCSGCRNVNKSPTTVLFRTALTRMITQYELLNTFGFKPFTMLNKNKVYSIFTCYSSVLQANITTRRWENKIHCYLEDVDTLDDVDTDEDVEKELEVETLKTKYQLTLCIKP